MKLVKIKILLFTFCLLGFSFIPKKPNPPKLVNNLSQEFPEFLSLQDQQSLENKLVAFEKETSNQICVVFVDDYAGTSENDFATRIFNEWGIGQKGKENGVLVLVKVGTKDGNRRVYINTGYGLEGVIPDIMAKRIVDETIIPFFKQQKYYNGLDEGTNILMQLAKGEYQEKQKEPETVIPIIVFIFIVLLFIILTRKASKYYGGHTFGNTGRSDWGRGFGGGGLFGGGGFSGGGGFGGFGGGRSGGGGAGGSW